MTAACDLLRERLLTFELDELDVADHLDSCSRCSGVVQLFREQEALLDQEIDGFVGATNFEAAFAHATHQPMATRRRVPAAAAAIVIVVAAVVMGWSMTPTPPKILPIDPVQPGLVWQHTSEQDVAPEPKVDLTALELDAILGKLDAKQVERLYRIRNDETHSMHTRSKASRILMINAFALGQTQEWSGLIEHHLNHIEDTDPELHYKYALHLSKQGPSAANGVIRHAEMALNCRVTWTNDTYVSRVHSLYRIRAVAAEKAWREASSVSNKADRRRAARTARDWMEFAELWDRPAEVAYRMCEQAAPDDDFCS